MTITFSSWCSTTLPATTGRSGCSSPTCRPCTPGDQVPPLPVQFVDYAVWELGQQANGTRHLDYWRAQLADLTPIELPTDRPRPAVRDWRGRLCRSRCPPVTSGRSAGDRPTERRHPVHDLVDRVPGATQPAHRIHRYPDRHRGLEYAAGPNSSRSSATASTAWCCAAGGRGIRRFSDLLTACRTTVAEAFEHIDAPFAVARRRDRTGAGHVPHAAVPGGLHDEGNPHRGARTYPASAAETLEAESPVARFDLTLQVDEAPDGTADRHPGVRDGAVRPGHRAADDGPLRPAAGSAWRSTPETRVSDMSMLGDAELRVLLAGPARRAADTGHQVCARDLRTAGGADPGRHCGVG